MIYMNEMMIILLVRQAVSGLVACQNGGINHPIHIMPLWWGPGLGSALLVQFRT